MLKKLISVVLMLAASSFALVLIGCEKDEIKVERQVEIKDKVVSQDTVVK